MSSLVHHPNIAPICGVTMEDERPLSLVLELQEASLAEVMDAAHKSGYYLTLREQVDLTVGCLAALTYLHGLMPDAILHGDIRPSNVLVSALMVAKLSDLGSARLVSASLSVGPLSPIYVAPERNPGSLASPCHNTKEADVYSAGVTMAELFTGIQVGENGKQGRLAKIARGDMFDLCVEMEAEDPSQRPGAKEALRRMEMIFRDRYYKRCPSRRMVRGLLHGSMVRLVATDR